MKVRVRFLVKEDMETLNIPEGWLVFNSVRPTLGHKTWIDDNGFAGFFYTIVDPSADDAQEIIENIAESNGAILLERPSEEQILDDVQAWYDKKYANHPRLNTDVSRLPRQTIIDFWYRTVAPREIETCDL